MALNIVGIGLSDEKDITMKGLELVRQSDEVYLEFYTSKLAVPVENLESFYGKKVEIADRNFVENLVEEKLLKPAMQKEITLLIIGEPLAATTHIEIVMTAKAMQIPVRVVHNASIITAVAETGLQVYKFGKTWSIPFTTDDYVPETPYDVLLENQSIGAHTLFLLDLKPEEGKFLSIPDAIRYLQKIEIRRGKGTMKDSTFVVGCARMGQENNTIISGKAKDLIHADFGEPPYCLIVPGKLHFTEEEALEIFDLKNH
jgi:diphthine synthase